MGLAVHQVFIGIDVAIAKEKRLPLAACTRDGGRVAPLPLNDRSVPKPPQGCGNAATVDKANRRRLVEETVEYLRSIERRFDVSIRRIAIDAPSAPRSDGAPVRAAEGGLRLEKIDFIKTPTQSEFEAMPDTVRRHILGGGSEAKLPCANQLWMLFGFDLFEALTREGWECLEVYPQATVRCLGAGQVHKSKEGAVLTQMIAAAKHTNWPAVPHLSALKNIAYGSAHDRLDAYLAAWVASLEDWERRAIGLPPNDAIWVPKVAPNVTSV